MIIVQINYFNNNIVIIIRIYKYNNNKLMINFEENNIFFIDRKLKNEIKAYDKKINSRTKKLIGSTNVFLEGVEEYCKLRECSLGNFILDSFVNYVSYYKKYYYYYYLIIMIINLIYLEYKNKL